MQALPKCKIIFGTEEVQSFVALKKCKHCKSANTFGTEEVQALQKCQISGTEEVHWHCKRAKKAGTEEVHWHCKRSKHGH